MDSLWWQGEKGRRVLNRLTEWIVESVEADASMASSLGMSLGQLEEEFPFGVHRG